MNRILIVDDEQDLCEILQFNLESEGYIVDTANSAEEALQMLSPEHDLILLDVMMEKMSGYQMANKVRKELNNNIPIIFLTAKTEENDTLTAFSLGADDFITKPFSLKTVLARLKAVLKRASIPASDLHTAPNKELETTGLRIDFDMKTVTIENEEIILTKKEFQILTLLVQMPKHFFTREQIMNKVWEEDACVTDRTVDVHITRLRKKLGSFGNHIINRTGFGYYFEP